MPLIPEKAAALRRSQGFEHSRLQVAGPWPLPWPCASECARSEPSSMGPMSQR